MFTTAEKSNRHTTSLQRKQGESAFFGKSNDEAFFGGKETGSFFSPPVQAKLTVSSPDDPQEKEADAVADQVMRMADPVVAAPQEEEKVQTKEEEKEETVQTQPIAAGIQRACATCEEEKTQAKLFRVIQRSGEGSAFASDASEDAGSDYTIDCKPLSIYRSDVVQRSGRGPPVHTPYGSFEQSLSSSKGTGNPMPSETRQFMESRFGADFSGVRIHTGSHAQDLSSTIHAQAFTYGNDIYFNSGKYAPHTEAGSTLLAHELTHTIQQGASKSNNQVAATSPSVSRKKIIQRSAVPSQLTNAVAKAKTVEGKIDANKPQSDGLRTGWEHLVEIFKTTFGEEMIVSGGGGAPKGAVAEQDIKMKREQSGVLVVDTTTVTTADAIPSTKMGTRDAMPSWCGIFAFWALNKSGVPMPKWKLGERMIKPEAARPPGSIPLPGDIAYRNAFSHFALVESATSGTVRTVNGNTAGDDNLGGQVQTIDHPMSNWTAFFNPLMIMEGSLGTGEGVASQTEPKPLSELRKGMDQVSTKREEDGDVTDEAAVQTKPELSNWHVDSNGALNRQSTNKEQVDLQKKEERLEEEHNEPVASHELQAQRYDGRVHELLSTHDSNAVGAPARVQRQEATEAGEEESDARVTIQQKQEVRGRGPPVHAVGGQPAIQRSVIDDALEYTSLGALLDCVSITDLDATSRCLLRKARDVALHIPGYRALRVVLGRDPITGENVARNGHNFIEAAFDIMPGGMLLHRKLQQQNQLDAAAEWIDGKIADLETIVNDLFSDFDSFWNDLGLTDFRSPMRVIRNGANIVLRFINRIIDFAVDAAKELLKMVKDFLLEKIVDFVKEHTTAYPLLTVILGEDPITKQQVEFNGTNVLNAILELGGEEGIQQRTQMQETGTFEKVVGYIDEGIAVFGGLYDTIVQNFSTIWDLVTIDALMEPTATFQRIYNIFAQPIAKVLDFVVRVGREILKLIKEALMQRLSAWAREQRGYTLVTVLIGKDPFTDAVVPRTMENVIRGFFGLMEGGEEQYNQLKESGAIDRTVAKVNAAVARLNMTPAAIVQLFIDLWNSFSIRDLINPIAAFRRIIATFGEPIGRLIAFVIEIVKIVIEAILIVMNFPFDLINNIITKAMQAFELIKRDPVAFLKNLLRAIKEGFMQFFDNILTHLVNGLKEWFLGEVRAAGIPIPTDFTVMGILKWLLAVLDITMEKIWKKLEERIGKPKVDKIKRMIDMAERVADAAGEAYALYQDIQQRGFMAVIIDKIKEQLSNVWDLVLDAVKSFVMDQIIKKVTVKLLSMLDPTGIMAVVNSAIALYKAVQSFIRYLRQMLEIVNSFVEGTLQIAQGATKQAADFLEGALARGIPIVIGFLANQVGLNLSERLKDALELVRDKVDKGLTWVIDKLVVVVEKLVSFGRSVVAAVTDWWKGKKEFTANDTKQHKVYFDGDAANPTLMIQSDPKPYTNFLTDYENKLGSSANDEVTVGSAKKTKSAVIAEAKTIAGNIETEKRKQVASYPGADDNAREEAKKAAIDALLQQLANISVPLFGTDKPTDAEIILPVGVNNHQFASEMEAINIYKTPKVTSNGSGPTSAKHNIYDVIDNRQKGKASYYIRGHLINDNLGGPGMWTNMTALSRTGNHQHEAQVESKVKAAFDSGAVVRYKVKATGNQVTQPPTAADKSRFTRILDFDSNFQLLVNIINAEGNVVTSLECEAYTRKKEGSNWVDDTQIVKTTVTNEVELGYDTYELGDNVQPATVNINTASADQLGRLAAIGSVKAAAIVAYRNGAKVQPPATKVFESVQDLSKVPGIGAATVESVSQDNLVQV